MYTMCQGLLFCHYVSKYLQTVETIAALEGHNSQYYKICLVKKDFNIFKLCLHKLTLSFHMYEFLLIISRKKVKCLCIFFHSNQPSTAESHPTPYKKIHWN
jgi:hypothetical protein